MSATLLRTVSVTLQPSQSSHNACHVLDEEFSVQSGNDVDRNKSTKYLLNSVWYNVFSCHEGRLRFSINLYHQERKFQVTTSMNSRNDPSIVES
jgi:hypothetical protein